MLCGGAASGRDFFAPPRPNHDAKSSQPRFFGCGGADGVGGNCTTGVGFGGSGRTGRTAGAVMSAPNSWARVSQADGFFG
jgi:hypothetical protein